MAAHSPTPVVVVGGGLAGLAAACELLEQGLHVTILEKTANLGGNATKATCGILGAGTAWQKQSGVQDDAADLLQDGPAAKALIEEGAKDLEWLIKSVGVSDDLILRVTPGHGKTPRTIGTKTHLPGSVVTYAAVHLLEQVAKSKPDRLEIITGATVTRILATGDKVEGVEYSKGGIFTQFKGAVILATGGFLGDTSKDSLLAKNSPLMVSMPTTNDERSNGDGIKLAVSVGAKTEGLNKIHLHPTAAVPPGQETAQFKIILSDALAGAGAKLLNASGQTFVDELATASARATAIAQETQKGPVRLVLPVSDAAPVQWLVDFYTQRKVMKKIEGGAAALAKEMGVASLEVKDGPLYVASITPALYTCAGGLATGWEGSSTAKVLNNAGAPIPGLFAAGEVAAAPFTTLWDKTGVPLLFAIYSGRLAAKAAAEASQGKGERADLRTLIISSLTSGKAAGAELVQKEEEKKEEEKKEPEKNPEDMTVEELVAKIKELEASGAVAAAPAKEAGPPTFTLEEVAKHNKKDDAWIVLFGEVIDVTRWISIHPGGEQAICAYLGQDATEEWRMIHKPGTVEKNLQHVTKLGKIGSGAGAAAGGGEPVADGIPMSEVAKHNTKEDAWIVLFGEAIDVTRWISIHPGGEQAICAYLGQDATEEWQMIHKPGTVEKNLQHVKKMGKVQGGGGGAAPPPAAVADDYQPIEGYGKIPGWIGAVLYLIFSIIKRLCNTIFFTGNFKFTLDNNRNGTIRSAIFLITFIIIHALGNFVDMIGGPEELNGEGYLFDRIRWTGGGSWAPASLVEEYLALALLLHVTVALKRSWDISMNYCVYTGRWNMLISGLTVLTFLQKHLQDFRFHSTETTLVYPPPYFIAFDKVLSEGRIFNEGAGSGVAPVKARDLYTLEVTLFKDLGNVLLYTTCLVVFILHLCLGWKKLIPAEAMQIPKDHQTKVIYIGWAAAAAIAGMYASVPWYMYFTEPYPVIRA